MAKITINGEVVKVKSGTTILNAANSIGVEIPTLCFIKEINEIGFCRICVVEVEGEQDLVSACNTEIKNGMVITTDSDKVIQSRTATLQLLASKHRFDCWRCPKDGMCEFYDLLKEFDVTFEEFGPGKGRNPEQIPGTGISQDQSKCVLCKRCVAVCANITTAKVLKFRDDNGINPIVSPTPGLSFDESGCIFCGQCVKTCPTGTLFETNSSSQVEELLRDKDKTVVVQVTPEVRASLAEEFNYDLGTKVEEVQGKIYNALYKLGFDEVTDTLWAADLTIKEKAEELVKRMENGETLPMFTSYCPAWVRYTELYNPEYLNNLSTAKSPHMMQGTLIKNYFAPKYLQKQPHEVAVVTIASCTAKKYEITREEMEVDGVRNIDAVLTVREIAKLLKRRSIDLQKLDNEMPKGKLSEFAGTKSYHSNNVLEQVLNTVSETLDQKPLEAISYKTTFGEKQEDHNGVIKEAQVRINNQKMNIAVVSGGAALKEMYTRLNGKKQYHFIEFMACPGGCLNGGGTPFTIDIPMHKVIKRRNESLCSLEVENTVSEAVNKTYSEFLNNEDVKAKYLQTTYSQKEFRKE